MNLPKIEDLDFQDKKVLLRADLDIDVPKDGIGRLEALLPTLKILTQKAAKITIIGHKGRPEGRELKELSLDTVSVALEKLLVQEWGEEKVKNIDLEVSENLRFDSGEVENNEHYAEDLAEDCDVYINEAFAASHRKHASIIRLPELLPSAAGLRFIEEVENLEKVLKDPKRPVLLIIGGIKKDKLDYLEDFKKFADKILIGGRLPEYMPEEINDKKLLVAKLIMDKEDITIHAIEKFEEEISKAGTIVVAGPMGKCEEEGHMMGTKRVFKAIADSQAYKLAGGGETQKTISILGLTEKFDWISVGGGASLEFLAKGTLPGIEALLN
ncbi:phosphoglycerate kinase [Patescibacteria group bacterium]|nr:phosphoglycerate kinase [Patescibacteria group bacterium]MBU0777396.1 phosphoglycerate kinase [Patescibacteria group bacterium]MBU0846032.1 phosphoglycerate kinase [Patescibacteria group bacterium]MBU0922468.1 phosphoglycerate kinase [Patescibacteria group bacterium]MBU1066799.1 phosphoglycerate kinase [Patescibacteria group bacterium]